MSWFSGGIKKYRASFCLLALISLTANAGLFGPSNPRECLIKYHKQVNLEDAKNLLMFACGVGYSGNVNAKAEKIGRCIASEANQLYSFESSLRIINKCTKNNEEFFPAFRDALFENVNNSAAMNQRQNRWRQEDAIKDALKNCTVIGSEVRCN
jgi:hypothetical protein